MVISQDLFLFKTIDSKLKKKRAVLGNGFMGMEVSNNFGQGFGFGDNADPQPTLILGGAYSYGTDSSVPSLLGTIFRPMNPINLILPAQVSRRMENKIKNFSQELDMKRAVIITKGFWPWGSFNTHTQVFINRAFPHIGSMQVRFDPLNSDEKKIHEFLYMVTKDKRVQYEAVEFQPEGSQGVILRTKIKEDYYNLHQLGLFEVIQLSSLQIQDSNGNNITFESNWKTENASDIGSNGEYRLVNHLKFECQGSFIITIHFGVYTSKDQKEHLVQFARTNFSQSIELGWDKLLQAHEKMWDHEVWTRVIEVPNNDIQRKIIAGQYFLGCSLNGKFPNSVGPNGLNGSAWNGRVFWDADLWVNMGSVLWAPEFSHSIVSFRENILKGSFINREVYSKAQNYSWITEGAKIAWESGSSGIESGPPKCHIEFEEHINCNVVYGQYLYYTITQNEEYLKRVAFPISYESCVYLGQRVRKINGKYHFLQVIPADEFAPHFVDDDAFTNLFVVKCLLIVIQWCKKLGKTYPTHWDEICQNMYYNFDAQRQIVLEYTGYKGQKIKQADVDLLTFPLEWPFSDEIKRNNMLYYFGKLPRNHILMGSAIFSVIACELGMMKEAWTYFADQFAHFQEKQFNIPSEAPKNNCWPFITGLGGFFMNIVYGFGGIRIRSDGLLLDPILPKQIPELILNQIHYQGKKIRMKIGENGYFITLTSVDTDCNFRFYLRKKKCTRVNPLGNTNAFVQLSKMSDTNQDAAEIGYDLNMLKGIEYQFRLCR